MKTLTAKTKRGDIINIAPEFGEKFSITASSNTATIKIRRTDFITKDNLFCLHLDSTKAKRLLGIDIGNMKAAVVIEEENAKDVLNAWKDQFQSEKNQQLDAEISQMKSGDMITLYAYSGYGMHYSINSEKLSYDAAERASRRVNQIMDMFPKKPAPEMESDIAYKVEITWGEYQRINNELDTKIKVKKAAEQKARDEKFEEARITGKPVVISREIIDEDDLPRKYRAEESSTAFVTVFAMPDGKIEQEITHAH